MNELKHRGVADVWIAVTDSLKGFPEAITAMFPQAMVQTPDRGQCRLRLVHLLRHSLDLVSWKDRKPVAPAPKEIYRAVDADAGETAPTAVRARGYAFRWKWSAIPAEGDQDSGDHDHVGYRRRDPA